ncbi:hypothetical protein PLESTF_001744900 [Pleodorina starrii]|nr:hypothetical protein PLESTF_001744900 [Pleodorina starrii]
MPAGYSIDQKKTVLWLAGIAADVAHLALGSGPRVLVATSLAGSVAGFGALYGCLRRLHPLMVRVARAEGALRGGNATLLRTGTRWATAFSLFRLPTSLSAGLAAVRAASDLAAACVALLNVDVRSALNPSLGLLLVTMVLAVAMINALDDVGFGAAVLAWLVGLIAASHTLLMVKGFCVALAVALAMRAAVKYVPEEDDVSAAKEALEKRTKAA